jgi:hypothetical protein
VQQPSLYIDHVGVSEIAQLLKRCEQRVRQLFDSGHWPGFRDPDGKRWIHEPSVRAWQVEREVRQLLTGERKRGPKGPRRSVPSSVYTREFEAATA